MKKKHCNSPEQKAVAKLAYAIGRNHPIRNVNQWQSLFIFYLKNNEDIIKKYLRMGNSRYWHDVSKANEANVKNADTRVTFLRLRSIS